MLTLAPVDAEVTLAAAMYWVDIATNEPVLAVTGHLVGEGREIRDAVLLVVEFDCPIIRDELTDTGLYLSEKFGPFAYVKTKEDQPGRFAVSFRSPAGRIPRRIGLRLWGCEGPLRLSDLAVTVVHTGSSPPVLPEDFDTSPPTRLAAAVRASAPLPGRGDALQAEALPSGEVWWLQPPEVIGNRITVAGAWSGAAGQGLEAELLVAVELSGAVMKDSVLATNGLLPPNRQAPFISAPVGTDGRGYFRAAFSVPDGTVLSRVGLWTRTTGARQHLTNVTVARAILSPIDGEVLVNISVDVEALPARAASDHVAKLIYGRMDSGEYGVPLQMRVFREMGVPATFYLECGQCALWGPEAIGDVAKLILDAGFDLQLHLHSEVVARAHGWKWGGKSAPPYLSNLDRAETFRAMGFAVEHFYRMAGQLPTAFRAGGYLFNQHTLEALGDFGILASSNYRADQRPNAFDFEGAAPLRPFRWSNGVLEFPVTISPEPLSALSPHECWRRILHHVQINRTWVVNVVIHSWSFMHRDPNGHHVWRGTELMDNLIKFVELAPAGVRFVSIKDITEAARTGAMAIPLEKQISSLIPKPT